jgi:hypothetical protein
MLSPAQISQKWLTNYQNSGTAMTQGVQAVQQAPGQAAAAQVSVWLARIQQSQQKWATRVASVSLASWQQAMIQRGIPNGQTAAAAKQDKYTAFVTQYMQFLPGAVAQVKGMPKGTIAQSGQRALAMMNLSYQWGQSRG